MPSARQELLFRLFNWSVFFFATVLALFSFLMPIIGTDPAIDVIAGVVVFLLGILGLLIVFLFFLNLPLMLKLIRQASLRRRLGLKQTLEGAFKAGRGKRKIVNRLTLLLTLIGGFLVITGIGNGMVWIGMSLDQDYMALMNCRHAARPRVDCATAFAQYTVSVMEALKWNSPLLITSFTLIMIGLSLSFLHFMRRGKQRLEIITNLQASLLKQKEAFERGHEIPAEISESEYGEIARIETTHIIEDRARSIGLGRNEAADATYLIQNSREMLSAKDQLDLEARARVETAILQLSTEPSPSEASKDRATGVPSTSRPRDICRNSVSDRRGAPPRLTLIVATLERVREGRRLGEAPMPPAEFTEYAIKYSREARKSRKCIPVEHLPILGEIEAALADNPDQYPERVIPASRDGKSFVYMHPSPRIQITYEVDKQNKIIFFFHFAEPLLKVPNTIFISYSHKDVQWLNKIRMFLSVLEQEGVIKFWDDEQLEPGQLWEGEIKQVLDLGGSRRVACKSRFPCLKVHKGNRAAGTVGGSSERRKEDFLGSFKSKHGI